MNWDIIETAPCLIPPGPCDANGSGGTGGGPPPPPPPPPLPCCDQEDFRSSNPTVCNNDDARCSDPAFAMANPLLCPNAPRLVLKPGYLLKSPLQQVTYQVSLLSNGVESLLTTGVVFQSQNGAVATIGAASGKCSTVAPGLTTISATFGQLTAYGQLEVIADCATHSTEFIVLIDNSASMNVGFGGLYATKLDFAKNTARNFLDTIDFTRDKVAVFDFSGGAQMLQALTPVKTLAQNAIAGISMSSNTTNLKTALQAVIDYLGSKPPNTTFSIVLFSDGENKTGGNPLGLAASFQSQDNPLIVVGCRAYGGGFTMLDLMASGGFFINAYPENLTSVPLWLASVKSYFCSGNCAPTDDFCVPYAQLNYTHFKQWDVAAGTVDLIGDGGKPLFDLLPGNGLYVDMRGSSPVFEGKLTTKTAISFTVAAGAYVLTVRVAGNQRLNVAPWSLAVKIGSLLNDTIVVTDYLQTFTEYTFPFVASGTVSAKIEISTLGVPPGADIQPYTGLLLKSVLLRSSVIGDLSDAVTVFTEDFDTENVTCFKVCGPDVCPATCEPPQPALLEIVGYNDGYFDLSPCLLIPAMEGLNFCTAGTPWNGVIPQVDSVDWTVTVIDGTDGNIGSAGSLAGGKAINFIGISFDEDNMVYNMSLSMRACAIDGGAPASAVILWEGTKCGTNPTGIYTRTSGCLAHPTITIRSPGQPDCDLNAGYGCADDAPTPAQLPDPHPTTDIEPC